MPSDYRRKLDAAALEYGAVLIRTTANGHLLFRCGDGTTSTCASDSKEPRALKNAIADLKRKRGPVPVPDVKRLTELVDPMGTLTYVRDAPMPPLPPLLPLCGLCGGMHRLPDVCKGMIPCPCQTSVELPAPQPAAPEVANPMPFELKLPAKSNLIPLDRLKNGQMAKDGTLEDLLIYYRDPGGRTFALDMDAGKIEQMPKSAVDIAKCEPLPLGTALTLRSAI